MDTHEIDKMWDDAVLQLFDSFVKENIGYKEGVKEIQPKCFGSGDSRNICSYCSLKTGC
jgi:hypothetical protein